MTSRPPRRSSPAPPGRWASPSRTSSHRRLPAERGRAALAQHDHTGELEMQRSKGYRNAATQIDRSKLYAPAEAIRLAQQTSPVRFDATVEVAMRLGVDPRKA